MIVGHGIDVVEITRIQSAIESSDRFLNKVFTEQEIDYCCKRKALYHSFAARFAAKEAFLKALGIGLRDGISLKDIEVINNSQGKPIIKLYNKALEIFNSQKISNISVSLSHADSVAVASVVFEKYEHITN